MPAAQFIRSAIDDARWTHLDLEDERIVDVAVTLWGVFAGTADGGIFRLKSDLRNGLILEKRDG